MKSKLYFIVAAVLLSSCIKNYPGDYRTLPAGTDATVTLRSTYISNTPSELIFEVDISWLVNAQFPFIDIRNSLGFAEPGKYTLLDTLEGVVNSNPSSSSTIVLIDESGNYDSTDAFNYRSKGINKFCMDTKAPGNFLLGGFSRQGKLQQEPAEYFQPDFSSDATGQLDFLFDLAQRTGGNSSLFDAVNGAVARLATTVTTNRKNIVVLVHANDDGSMASPDSIISRAVLNDIRINIILLGKADPGPSAKLSEATGGIFAACPTNIELITVLNLLSHLLSEEGSFSRVRFKYEPVSGNILPGNETILTLFVHDASINYYFTSMIFYVKVPNR